MRKILIADADPHIRSQIRMLLQLFDEEIQIEEVENSKELISKYAPHYHDVLIMDFSLPGFLDQLMINGVYQLADNGNVLMLFNATLTMQTAQILPRSRISFLSKKRIEISCHEAVEAIFCCRRYLDPLFQDALQVSG